MEWTWLNIVAYILIPILTAGIGGWVGAFFGDKYRKDKESKEKEIVRDIAVKAQVQMGQIICNPQLLINPMTVSISGKKDEKEVK